MDGSYRDHKRLDGIDHSAGDSLEPGYHLGSDVDRVDCLMGCGAMATFSYYPDYERVWCCHYRASSEAEHSRVEIAVNVEAKYVIDLGIFHHAVFYHRFGASSASMLFGWLEEEFHCAVKLVFVIGE